MVPRPERILCCKPVCRSACRAERYNESLRLRTASRHPDWIRLKNARLKNARLNNGIDRFRRHTEKAPAMQVMLAQPRGFCDGVIRAIDIVEQALAKFGAPGYVRHEIVHN